MKNSKLLKSKRYVFIQRQWRSSELTLIDASYTFKMGFVICQNEIAHREKIEDIVKVTL